MTAGRPPKPLEVKQDLARGDGRTPSGELVVPGVKADTRLARQVLIPEIPAGEKFKLPAKRMWNDIWSAAWWLHDEDIHFVVIICRNADRIKEFQKEIDARGPIIIGGGYLGKSDVENPLIALVLKMERAMVQDLAQLGFGPTARQKLSLGEVKRATGLLDLQQRIEGNKPPKK